MFPDGRERLTWPGLIHVRVKPLWIRYSNFSVTAAPGPRVRCGDGRGCCRSPIDVREDRAASAAFTRSGVNGTSRMRAPVASKIALPIAAATTVIDVSPAPQASSSGWLISTVSMRGHGEAERQRAIGAPVDRRDLLLVPRHRLAERAAHALQRAAFDLVAHAVGVRDRARSPARRPAA